MSARMQLPLCQQRHSNVAVVRLTRCGVKLEIACYKNKVQSYRAGLETRLDEVLQIDRVFNNVSRGHYASMQDIKKALGEDLDEKAALKYILDNGDLQVAQQERSSELDDMMKDIATIISQKCVHNVTKRPFPSSVIEQALRNIGAVVKGDQPAKKQALQLVHQLIDSKIIPIERAMMKLRVNVANEECMLKMREWCAANGGELCTSSSSGLSGDVPVASDVAVVGEDVAPAAAPSAAAASVTSLSLLFLLAPPLFRNADAFVKGLGVNNTLNVVETSVAETGEGAAADLEAVLSHGAEVELNAHPAHVVVSSAAAESLRTKPTNKPSQKASKSKKDKANKNDDDSDSEAENVAAALASLRRKSDDDDDSDDGKKKKKKAKKAAAPANKPAAKAPPPKPAVTNGSDSDEDVQSQRKKRKNQPQQQQQHQQPVDDDDDNFDYGEDE